MNTLFTISLPNSDATARQSLYFHTIEGDVFVRDGLRFTQESTARFDTFFNGLSCDKYRRYTTLEGCTLQLDLQGDFEWRIYRKTIAHGQEQTLNKLAHDSMYDKDFSPYWQDYSALACTKLIAERVISHAERAMAEIALSFDADGCEGMLFFELHALSDGCLYGGRYATDATVSTKPKIGVVICTYRREAYVQRNLLAIQDLLDTHPTLQDAFEVFVVDNGQTIKESPVACAHIYHNKNLGGSGGFTRGIIEVIARGNAFSHFLLMDDDIEIQPNVLEKLYWLLSYARDTHTLAVGGAMLRLDKPTIQHEFGAAWLGNRFIQYNHNYDVGHPVCALLNEQEFKPDYSAWWFMCMPLCATQAGLPLPFFIKVDDIEYGMRWQGDIVLMNGIGVWHESFDTKYSGELEYYIKRNEIIKNTLHYPRQTAWFHVRKMIIGVALQLVYQRYDVARLILRAYRDFLRGPSFLLTTDATQLHAEIRGQTAPLYTGEQLKEQGYDVDKPFYMRPKKHNFAFYALTLNGYLIPTIFYSRRERKEGRLVELFQPKPHSFFRSALTVQYNRQSDRGMVTKQSRTQMVVIGLRLMWLCLRMLCQFPSVRRDYLTHFNDLTSLSTWQKLLDME